MAPALQAVRHRSSCFSAATAYPEGPTATALCTPDRGLTEIFVLANPQIKVFSKNLSRTAEETWVTTRTDG